MTKPTLLKNHFSDEQAAQHAEHARMKKHYAHLIADEAPLHAAKELGCFYDVALTACFEKAGDFTKALEMLHDKVAHQLYAEESKGNTLRTEEGFIKLGLLNLKSFGLSNQQCSDLYEMHAFNVQHQPDSLYLHDQDLTMRAVKELGSFLDEALATKGSMEAVVNEIRSQLPEIEAQGATLRKGSRIQIGLLDLEKLGLSPVSAAIRQQEIATSEYRARTEATQSASSHSEKFKPGAIKPEGITDGRLGGAQGRA